MFVFGIRPRLAWGMNEQDRDYRTEPLLPEWLTSRRLYRGWWVVLVGFFLLAVAIRAQTHTDLIFEMDRASTRAGSDAFPSAFDIYLFLSLAIIVAAIAGYAADRMRLVSAVIPIMSGAAVIFVAAELIEDNWVLYLAWLVIDGALAGALLIGFAKATTALFISNRGRALSALLAAVILATILPLPRIHRFLYWILPSDLARVVRPDVPGFQPLSLIDIAFLFVPGIILAYLLLRRLLANDVFAHSKGQFVSDDPEVAKEQKPTVQITPESSLPLRSVLLNHPHLLLLLASACQTSAILLLPRVLIGAGLYSFSPHYFPARLAEGLWLFQEPQPEVVLVGVLAVVVTGVLVDLYGARRVVMGAMVTQLICVTAIYIGIGDWSTLALAVVIGTGAGILCVPIIVLQVEYWGIERFGLALGILAATSLGVFVLFRELLSFVTPETQSEVIPYVVVALLSIALLLVLLMKKPRDRTPSAENEPQVAA